MTQYDRLKNGSATVAQINQEIATKNASRPLYKRIPAHILVEDYLVPHNLQLKDVAHAARIHPAVMARFVRGEERINEYLAVKLGNMFRTGKDYWLDIQAAYDDGKLD